MKYLNHKLHLYLFVIIILFSYYQCLAKNDYPKTIDEQQADEMGSILESGIEWSPKKVKSDSTKSNFNSDSSVNKYLWKASIQELKDFPIISADLTTGIIITGWCVDKNDSNKRIKLNIIINSDIISSESIDVRIFKQKLVKDKWIDDNNHNSFFSLEENILRKARDIYQLEQNKVG